MVNRLVDTAGEERVGQVERVGRVESAAGTHARYPREADRRWRFAHDSGS